MQVVSEGAFAFVLDKTLSVKDVAEAISLVHPHLGMQFGQDLNTNGILELSQQA